MDDYLPIGSHLLPEDYREFLYSWNKEFEEVVGSWNGPLRKTYKTIQPDMWKVYITGNRYLALHYKEDVSALKAYQAEYKDEVQEAPLELKEAAPRSHYYNHCKWPSPLAKVFVQYIRGRNAWDYKFDFKGAWTDTFKSTWTSAGNKEFKLTHDNCLRYLAYRLGRCSVEQFLEKSPRDVNKYLFGECWGVKGYYDTYRW